MLNDKIENIIINLPYGLSDDEKMVYLYHELGKILSKDEKFFYDTDYDYNEHKFSNPDEIDNFKVVCKSCAYLFSQVGIQIGLRLEPVELTKAIDGNLVIMELDIMVRMIRFIYLILSMIFIECRWDLKLNILVLHLIIKIMMRRHLIDLMMND